MIKIKPDYGNRQAFLLIRKTPILFRDGIYQALCEIGSENVKHLRGLLKDRTTKTGHWYFYKRHASHGGGFWYQASAPGEAPAKRSSLLMRTTSYRVRGRDEVEFGDKQRYGAYLERGTKKIKPRPHIVRTAKEKERDNYNALAQHVLRRLRAGAVR